MSRYMEKDRLFESAPVGKAVIRLAVPTVIAQLITVVYNMADTFFIGQLGDPDQVAAATLYFCVVLFRNRRDSVITPSFRRFTLGGGIPAEVLTVGLPGFFMTLMSTLSNLTLNKMISGYSNEAVAGMGIAKKIDLMAFAIAQGMSQGALPLIGYNYSAGNYRRMLSALKVLLIDCLTVAVCAMALMFFGAAGITRCFIDDAATVAFGRTFLRIVCLACPTTALNFMAITIFQATGRKIRPLILSLLRKGGLDIPLMFLFNAVIGVNGIAWATPLADAAALVVSLLLTIPYLKKLSAVTGVVNRP